MHERVVLDPIACPEIDRLAAVKERDVLRACLSELVEASRERLADAY